jgi:hypothetical protein
MSWRKWVVRSLVLAILTGLAGTSFLYQHWTDPRAVRQQVLAKLRDHLSGALISLDSAHLRLLGGIAISELRLCRRDDPDRADVAYIPSGLIYHDKEQLLHGKLAIRKIELHRPRLRVIRGRDGSWNLENILSPPDPDQAVPTIEIKQGTIIFEDRTGSAAPLEIKDVHLTLLNNPSPRMLVFEGAGLAELLGRLQINGSYERKAEEFALSLEAASFPVGPSLVQRLADYQPEQAAHARHLEGRGKFQADLHHHPDSPRPWTYTLALHLTQGKLTHALLPLPLDQLEAKVRCADGLVTLESLSARADSARLKLSGATLTSNPDPDFKGTLSVEHLTLSPELFAQLPERMHDIQRDFQPAGPIDFTWDVCRQAGQWRHHGMVRLNNLSGVCAEFHYPLERISGTLDVEVDPGKHRDVTQVNLVAYAGACPITIRGQVEGERPAALALDICGTDLPLDDNLHKALPTVTYQKLARSFHPQGLVDFRALIRREQGKKEPANRIVVRFHDASMHWDVFDYPLENVTGVLDIQPGHWEFREFHGTHKGGAVFTEGRSEATAQGDELRIQITGKNILFDSELEQALQPEIKSAWKMFTPTGRADFKAQVTRLPGQSEPDIDVTVQAQDCTIQPAFFPYRLENLQGTVRYAQRWLFLTNLSARHDQTRINLDEGKAYVKQEGGVWVDLTKLESRPCVVDADFIRALPPPLKKACETLRLQGPVALQTQLVIDVPGEKGRPPVIYWNGGMEFADAKLEAGVAIDQVTGRVFCRGSHNGQQLDNVEGNFVLDQATILNQPFRQLHSHMAINKEAPDIMQFPNLKAQLFGGQVGGEARVEFGSTLRFELHLLGSHLQLEEFGRHNHLGPNAQLSGLAELRLHLAGSGAELTGLEGAGQIDIPSGKIANLSPLLDLLKVLSGRLPDRTAFEEAHAKFDIHGSRIHFNQLDLFGNVISLGGQGEMSVDGGDLDLDFYAVWGRLPDLLPSFLKTLPIEISHQLLKIEMRGRLGDVRCEKKPVPVLVEPLRQLMVRLRDGKK